MACDWLRDVTYTYHGSGATRWERTARYRGAEDELCARCERRRPHARPPHPRQGRARFADGRLERDRAIGGAPLLVSTVPNDLGEPSREAPSRSSAVRGALCGVVQLPWLRKRVGARALHQRRDSGDLRGGRRRPRHASWHVQARFGATSQAVFSVATAPVVAAAGAVLFPQAPAAAAVADVAGPSARAAARRRRRPAGQAADGAVGSWSGTGRSSTLPLVRCNPAGARCKRFRRDEPRLHARAKDVGRRSIRCARPDSTGTSHGMRASSAGRRPKARLVSTSQPTSPVPMRAGARGSAGSWSPNRRRLRPVAALQRNGPFCRPLPGATASTYAVRRQTTGMPARGRPREAASRIPVRGQRRDSRCRHRPEDRPDEPRAAHCGGDEPAGQTAHGLDRTLVRLGHDQLRLPVVPLRRGGRALQLGPRRHEADLHARRQGRGPHARLRRPRHRCDGHRYGLREPRRPGCGSRRHPRIDGATDDRRPGQAGAEAPGL